MNYQKLYNNIILNAQSKVNLNYTESHHIIPKFMGGTDDKSNLVKLTAKEHFICHLLLVKFVPKNKKYAATKSVYMMLNWNYNNQKVVKNKGGLSNKIIRFKHPPMPDNVKQLLSEAAIKQFQDPTKRQRHLDAVNNRWTKPEEHQKMKIAQTERFKDPNEGEKISKGLNNFFANNISPNKDRSYSHLSIEQRNELFGSKNKGRIQSKEEIEKRAAKLRKPRSAQACENIRLGALKREAARRLKNETD